MRKRAVGELGGVDQGGAIPANLPPPKTPPMGERYKSGGITGLTTSPERVGKSRRKGVGVEVGKRGEGPVLRLSKLQPAKVAEALDRFWPDCFKAARALGVHPSLMSYHKTHSPWYQRIYETIKQKHTDAVEAVLYRKAVSGEDYTFNDRCMYLKAYRPELYDRAKVIKLEDNRVGLDEARRRQVLATTAVDAEIVKEFKGRKTKKQGGPGGLLPAGGKA